jgi:hypothetical protein
MAFEKTIDAGGSIASCMHMSGQLDSFEKLADTQNQNSLAAIRNRSCREQKANTARDTSPAGCRLTTKADTAKASGVL